VKVIGGRYELGTLLGAGGMADVYRARDALLDREVAVKLFRPGGEVARARAEVRLHAGLSHRGLVSAYDAGSDEHGQPFLVLQLVDGPTLAERLRGRRPGGEEVRLLGIELAEALAHVHDRGIVHRDVKPANVLLARDGSAHLSDFGIAQQEGQDGLTATGFTLGTVPYLSPEQVRGGSATPASDVWALGLVLLECLTGRREYPGMSAEGALARLSRPPVVPSTLPAPFPPLLRAMTAQEPSERPTARDVAAALRGGPVSDAAPTMTVPVVLPGREPAPDPRPAAATTAVRVPAQRRSRSRSAAAATGALLVTAAVALPLVGGGTAAVPAGASTPSGSASAAPASVERPSPLRTGPAQAGPAAAAPSPTPPTTRSATAGITARTTTVTRTASARDVTRAQKPTKGTRGAKAASDAGAKGRRR